MRYKELSKEDKAKYGPELFERIEYRKKQGFKSGLNIDDYVLCIDDDGDWGWIYYPEIDD